MTIEIHRPELEALIRERMKSGEFQNVEDVLMEALKSLQPAHAPNKRRRPEGRKSLAQLFAESPFKGLNIDFERDPDYGRDVEL
jgi:Arc/MetJ-type ribon-helix-helix transcriptional regulator